MSQSVLHLNDQVTSERYIWGLVREQYSCTGVQTNKEANSTLGHKVFDSLGSAVLEAVYHHNSEGLP